MSSATIFLFFRPSGTSCRTIRCASPSTTAVLPTPGSPISTGLFFVRRESTWMTRRISSSRPMTGSSLPLRASSVRSRPYFSSDWYVLSGFCEVTRCVAADGRERLEDRVLRGAELLQQARGRRGAAGLAGEREQQVLRADVLVLQPLGFGLRGGR